MSIPSGLLLSVRASRAVDQLAMEEFHIPGIVLMENAGRGATDVLMRRGVSGSVAVCCGKGNNGGDGLVIARHLWIRGRHVAVHFFGDPERLTGDAALNYRILSKTRVPITRWPEDFDPARFHERLVEAEWIVDALLGTGTQGPPRSPFDRVIDAINGAKRRVLAVDIPSGLDADRGTAAAQAVRAECTCAFGTAKRGYRQPFAADYLGELYVVDIGAPPEVFERVAAE